MAIADFKRINYIDLKLDSKNPRLPKSMANKSEKEIINFFLSDASLIELMLAIGKNDFFEGEQLLVIPDNEKFLVVEGNRRLSAVKLLHDPSLAEVYKSKVEIVIKESDYFPVEIPCLIFKEKNDILKYLGFRHITGIKSWKLLEKARYMAKLKEDFFPSEKLFFASREIAKMIGSRKDYVIRVLVGYFLYEIIEKNNFYNIKDLNDSNFYFNYLADSLSHSNIERFLGINLEIENPTKDVNFRNLKEWTNWLFNKEIPNKIIGDSEHLNILNKVLEYPLALEVFRKGQKLTTALEYTNEIDIQFEKAIRESINQLEKADGLTIKVKSFYSGFIEDLQNINRIIRKIKSVKEEIETEKFNEEL